MHIEARLAHSQRMPALVTSTDDIAYVTKHFVPLAAVARPEAPFGVAIPDATYELPDGSRWFAADVWRIADDAGGWQRARALFARRYRAACRTLRVEGDLEADWAAYLTGDYGICLRDVTPETIVAKERLVARLDAALAHPRPDDAAWCADLRADVEALDGLEKPFASCDRARFGSTSRDRLIAAPRERYAAVFASDAAEPAGTTHDYAVALRWTGNTGAGTATYAGYGREYRVAIDGKPDLLGSADPAFRGARAFHNPEDLFVAALSACHMLAYLALCARHGVVVEAYRDTARGKLVERGGTGRFVDVVLAPRVAIAAGSDLALARTLHDRAAERCFIANSCAVAVRHIPETLHATEADRAPPPLRRDVAIRLPHSPGALAKLGELFGGHGISIEGGGGFTVGADAILHLLLADAERAAAIATAAGFEILGVREVVEHRLDQSKPGQLGALARALADAGVSIESVYSDHDHQLVLGVDNLDVARRTIAARGR